jgi:histidine ammonia-lyase
MMQLSGHPFTLAEIARIAGGLERVEIAPAAVAQMERSERVVRGVAHGDRPVYGINTGFGKLCEVRIPEDEIDRLQLNLIRSHACGIGRPLSEPETRAIVALRANTLALGYSGVRPVVARTLAAMLNAGVHPVIPEKGSVGASGDLAPLAHVALCVIGEGEAIFRGERIAGGEALRRAGIAPVRLEAKEGLALLNGTQVLTAVGALALWRARRVVGLADVAGAMTLEALHGTPVAFDQRIHAVRPHAGQAATAERLRSMLEGSGVDPARRTLRARVQDAYSLRCMPQVHGAVRGALEFARTAVEIETGSATDNPLVFAETGDILSGGNFHGAPLALAFDTAAIAMTTLAAIEERRIDRLVNPDLNEGLPAFLAAHPGVSSGFMIAHVAAVSLLNESKVLAHPASVDNVPTSGGQEDHVSMGMTAALKFRTIVENGESIAAIELLAAAEALRYRDGFDAGPVLSAVVARLREIAPPLGDDRPLSRDIEKVTAAIRQGMFDDVAQTFGLPCPDSSGHFGGVQECPEESGHSGPEGPRHREY